MNLVSVTSRDELTTLLRNHNVQFDEWGEKKLKKLWREVTANDAVYGPGDRFGEPHKVVRYLITLALRVMMLHPELGPLVLVEHVWSDEEKDFVPRRYADSSLSEKARVNQHGVLIETMEETAIRCLLEEARIHVRHDELVHGENLFFLSWAPKQAMEVIPGAAKNIETDYRSSDTYQDPNFKVLNQIVRAVVYLSPVHYFEDWRVDIATRYRSRLVAVSEATRPEEEIRRHHKELQSKGPCLA